MNLTYFQKKHRAEQLEMLRDHSIEKRAELVKFYDEKNETIINFLTSEIDAFNEDIAKLFARRISLLKRLKLKFLNRPIDLSRVVYQKKIGNYYA